MPDKMIIAMISIVILKCESGISVAISAALRLAAFGLCLKGNLVAIGGVFEWFSAPLYGWSKCCRQL